jgi:hypothetical protein
MLIREVTSKPVEKSAIGKEIKFRIKASAKAFRILSSTLYPDPVAAPLRELGTNAIDAQMEAGTIDQPFIVHLPNNLEPYVSIRDFGTGLSEKMVEDVYTVYFESPSAEKADKIGGYGLGSKTPFCYSDSFTVISYQNGKKYIYTAYLENGEPCIAKFAEEDTDAPNGLEVSFAVKPEDFSKFIHTAQRVYSRFTVKPKIVGTAEFKWEKTEYFMKGTNWAIREDDRQCFAVMGNIEYPMNAYKMHGLDHRERELLGTGLDLYFEIGEVSPSVSREELQYDNDTVAAIKAKLKTAADEIRQQVQEKFKDCKTLWEARCFYHENLGGGTLNGYRIRSLISGTNLTFNGEDVSQDSIYNRELMNLGVNWTVYTARGENTIRIREHNSIECSSKKVKFFRNDLDRGARARFRQHLLTNRNDIIVLVGPHNPDRVKLHNDKATVTETFDSLEEKFIKWTGILPTQIQLASSLPKPPKRTVQRAKGNGMLKSKVWNGRHRSYRVTYNWNDEEVDPKAGKHYYVLCEGFSPCGPKDTTNGSSYNFDILMQIKTALEAINVKMPAVHRVLYTSKLPEKRKNWISIYEFAKEKIAAHYAKWDKARIENSRLYNSANRLDTRSNALADVLSKINDKSIENYIKALDALKTDYDYVNKHYTGIDSDLCRLLDIKVPTLAPVSPDNAILVEYKRIMATYPLIAVLQTSMENLAPKVVAAELAAYINAKFALANK